MFNHGIRRENRSGPLLAGKQHKAAILARKLAKGLRKGYAGLVAAFRARAQQRHIAIAGSNVAAVSGLPSFYVAKLLSVHPAGRASGYR